MADAHNDIERRSGIPARSDTQQHSEARGNAIATHVTVMRRL